MLGLSLQALLVALGPALHGGKHIIDGVDDEVDNSPCVA